MSLDLVNRGRIGDLQNHGTVGFGHCQRPLVIAKDLWSLPKTFGHCQRPLVIGHRVRNQTLVAGYMVGISPEC
jgi:hypothetical protein